MSCPKVAFFTFFVVILFSSLSFATLVPAHAEPDNMFNISAEELIFTPIPWTVTGEGTISASLYTIADYQPNHEGLIKKSYLGFATLLNAGYSFLDIGLGSGDLAIKFFNTSGGDQFLSETVLTVYFERGPMDIYLPGFDLLKQQEMHFWVASDGSTYYANITGAAGSVTGLNMTAAESIAAGDVAAVPEPATMALLGLGGFFLRRRKTIK